MPKYKGYVYLIYNPQKHSDYYIGSTTSTPEERLKAHMCTQNKSRMCEYLKQNRDVKIVMIEEVMFEEINELIQCEDKWIWFLEPPLNTRMRVFELEHYTKKKKQTILESIIKNQELTETCINDQRYKRSPSSPISYKLSNHFQVGVNTIIGLFKSNTMTEQILVEFTSQTAYTKQVKDRYKYIKEICKVLGLKSTLDKETAIENANIKQLMIYFDGKTIEDHQAIIHLFRVRIKKPDLYQCSMRNIINIVGNIWIDGGIHIETINEILCLRHS